MYENLLCMFKKINKSTLFNFILRGFSALFKLIFLLYINNYTNDILTGQYALFLSIIALTSTIIGFEIHSGFGRKIHLYSNEKQKLVIASQLKFYLTVYLLVIFPLLFINNILYELNSNILFLIPFAIITEHLSIEIFRILITKTRATNATIFHFIRSSLLVFILILLDYLSIFNLTFEIFVIALFLINTISITCVCIYNQKYYNFWPNILDIINSKFIFAKLLIVESKYFYLMAILGSLISNIDKFVINYFLGFKELGTYYTIFAIGTVISLVISYTIGINQGPKLVKQFYTEKLSLFFDFRKKIFNSYIILSIGSASILFLCIEITNYFKITELDDSKLLIIIIFIAIILQNFTEFFKMDIYLAKIDKKLILVSVLSSIIYLIVFIMLSSLFGILGAGFALLLTNSIILLLYKLLSIKSILIFKKK